MMSLIKKCSTSKISILRFFFLAILFSKIIINQFNFPWKCTTNMYIRCMRHMWIDNNDVVCIFYFWLLAENSSLFSKARDVKVLFNIPESERKAQKFSPQWNICLNWGILGSVAFSLPVPLLPSNDRTFHTTYFTFR